MVTVELEIIDYESNNTTPISWDLKYRNNTSLVRPGVSSLEYNNTLIATCVPVDECILLGIHSLSNFSFKLLRDRALIGQCVIVDMMIR